MKKLIAVVMTATALCSTAAHAEAANGPRIEAKIGYDNASIDLGGLSISRAGFAYGGELGYDLPVAQNISVGVDAEVIGSTAKYTYGAYSVNVGRDLYAGGRLTVAATKNLNLYVKAGYANGRLTAQGPGFKVSDNGDGFRAGVGAQYLIDRNLYASIEYRYTTYQDDFSRNQVLTGLGYRF